MTTRPFEDVDTARIVEWLPLPSSGKLLVPEVQAIRVACTTEDEWLAARLEGIGASEVGVITGVSSWTSPYALWWRKKLDWRLPRTETARWGHLVEDPIAELFAEVMTETLYVAKPVGAPYSLWCHPIRQWMICTPDRLAVDRQGRVSPVELKSDEGGTGWGQPGTDEVPAHHRIQSLWQSYIFGAEGGWVVRHRGSGKGRLHVYWVPQSEEEMSRLVLRAGDFLTSIHHGEPPEPDGAKSTTETLKELNPAIDAGETALVPVALFDAWHKARAEKRLALSTEARVSNLLRAAMGRAEFGAIDPAGDGLHLTFVKRRIGKRAGYSVGVAETDELREINGGQHDTAPGVRPEADSETGAPAPEEGDGGGDPAATGLGDGEAEEEGGRPPGRSARVAAVDLPRELAELVDRALHGDPSERVHRKRPVMNRERPARKPIEES